MSMSRFAQPFSEECKHLWPISQPKVIHRSASCSWRPVLLSWSLAAWYGRWLYSEMSMLLKTTGKSDTLRLVVIHKILKTLVRRLEVVRTVQPYEVASAGSALKSQNWHWHPDSQVPHLRNGNMPVSKFRVQMISSLLDFIGGKKINKYEFKAHQNWFVTGQLSSRLFVIYKLY